MSYDDVIIGSGLSALATAFGLCGGGRRVLMLAGGEGGFRYYPDTDVPAARRGRGGMGSHWHGVIPFGLSHRPDGLNDGFWAQLAGRFYPLAGIETRIGTEQYFVPRRPIRPAGHLAGMAADGTIAIADADVERIEPAEGVGGLNRVVAGDRRHEARHVWLCAGALGTPGILARSGLIDSGPRTVSDHLIGYAGQLAASAASEAVMAKVRRHRDGVFFPFLFGGGREHFFTLRPARFDFAALDAGIAKRAVFGLPTSRVASGLAGNMSPGLIAEALYNKFGLFARAGRYSVYFQTVVPDAYLLGDDGALKPGPVRATGDAIARAQAQAPFADIIPTQQPALYIPGIHLHGSLTRDECERFGTGRPFNSLHVVDASALRDIGPEHHSFAMMAAAFGRAVTVASQDRS